MYILSEMAIRLMIEATVGLVILQTDHVLFQWYHPGTVLELDVNMCIVRRTIFLCLETRALNFQLAIVA